MAIASNWDGKCKDCGTAHKAGEQIEKNNNGTWCKNGTNCTGATNQPSTSQAKPSLNPKEVLEEITAFNNMFGELESAKFESLAKIYISRMMRR